MTEVILHVYDVTNSGSEKTNNTILNINKIFKDTIGLGGIFHSAVQVKFPSISGVVYGKPQACAQTESIDVLCVQCDKALLSIVSSQVLNYAVYGEDEWSFGFCEHGTGVFSCPSGKNPMYTYREKIVLGKTSFSIFKVNQILRELSREWPGSDYDLLAKNCNHFCDEFCERLGVPKLPGWVNRFANAGDAAMEIAGNTAFRFRQAKTEIVSASKVAYRFLVGVTSSNGSAPEAPANSNTGVPRFQASWFKNLITNGAKPNGTEADDQDEDVLLQRQLSKQGSDQPSWQNSQQEPELPPLHRNFRHPSS
ncbi:hypothetical protein POTOM_054296 [Populus tomentosa]|uniref:PPPDE domain-containing protein n=1 Tax=Populus tomentosa TaxID=118781 RepID=A0A8X7Y6V0_POPTO|nr:hypothetical protein POTOM_054296 [Populus tomentosa]